MASRLPVPQEPIDISQKGLAGDALTGEADVPAGDGDSRVYTLGNKRALVNAIYSGQEVEMDEDSWYFFRYVLPPIWENQPVHWPDGQVECVNFAFADCMAPGVAGPIVAFFVRWDGPQRRHFARNTGQML